MYDLIIKHHEGINIIIGVFGFLALLISAYIAHRKRIFDSGFNKFRDLYRVEMDEFKSTILSMMNTIRDIVNQNDERHTKTLDTIARYYQKTHDEIKDQNKVCDIVQASKPIIAKQEKEWKQRIENELLRIDKKVTHIEDCVNNKK